MNQQQLEPTLSKKYTIAEEAAKAVVAHLTGQGASYNGREITINEKKHLNFSSCSYLGLSLE